MDIDTEGLEAPLTISPTPSTPQLRDKDSREAAFSERAPPSSASCSLSAAAWGASPPHSSPAPETAEDCWVRASPHTSHKTTLQSQSSWAREPEDKAQLSRH